MDGNFTVNKLSDQIKNFSHSSHRFIQDPNFAKNSKEKNIESLFESAANSKDFPAGENSENSLFRPDRQSRPKIVDPNFQDKIAKDAFKYLYYSQKMKNMPEYFEHRKRLEEYDHNVMVLSMMSLGYILFLIFKKIDMRMTYYDRIDDIINDRPKKLYIRNKPFHFSLIFTTCSLLWWNLSKARKLENEYQENIRKKYLSKLKVKEKYPQTLRNL